MAPLTAPIFAVFVNGTEVPGTRYSQPLGNPIIGTSTICIPTDGSTVEVRNVSIAPVQLTSYNLPPALSASVVIQQLSTNTCTNT